MTVFSKTTLLENFKQTSSLLYKEDGKSEFQEFFLDEKFVPKDAFSLEGEWEVTVSWNPKRTK